MIRDVKNNKKICVITESSSDMLKIINLNHRDTLVVTPLQVSEEILDSSFSIAILGGVSEKPLVFSPEKRILIERQIKKGKKVFAEFCGSIGNIHINGTENTRFDRLVFNGEDYEINGLENGDIVEDQFNLRNIPVGFLTSKKNAILYYFSHHAHTKLENGFIDKKYSEDKALWFEEPENILLCSFRICNFNQARFSPLNKARSIVKYILEWLIEEDVNVDVLESSYQVNIIKSEESFKEKLLETIESAIAWFKNAGIIQDKGKSGALEGLFGEVYGDGSQKVNTHIRTDVMGEIALTHYLHYLISKDISSKEISDNLLDYIFKYMMCRDEENYGMIRWTYKAWGTCYQDDASRALIAALYRMIFSKEEKYVEDCKAALDFLVDTTGTDGTRVYRTDNAVLTKEKRKELKSTPGNLPSAHYNGYYYTALLMGYYITKEEIYKETAVKGLNTIMDVFPLTLREQSETEECCRLILPLSWLYLCTKKEEHKLWLYKVVERLENFKHKSGAYLEYDEGYRAVMRNTLGSGECSLLTKNGDKVVDLIYSNNWLPLGFIQGYLSTKDEKFLELWRENAQFFISSQIHSINYMIDGAWARSFDVELSEYYGSPIGKGWGPWYIQAGWSVAEITSGLIIGALKEHLSEYFF